MDLNEFINEITYLSGGGKSETPTQKAPEKPPQKPQLTIPEQYLQIQKALMEVFSSSPLFRQLSNDEKVRAVRSIMADPKKFAFVLEKDPYLRSSWEQLTPDEQKAIYTKIYGPKETPIIPDDLGDPLLGLSVGLISKALKKGASFLAGIVKGTEKGGKGIEKVVVPTEPKVAVEPPQKAKDITKSRESKVVKVPQEVEDVTQLKPIDDLEEPMDIMERKLRLLERHAKNSRKSGTETDKIQDSGKGGVIQFYSGGPSTEQFKTLAKVPEDPLKNFPDIEAKQFALWERAAREGDWKRWLLPQYEWLKKTPQGAIVYRAAKEYTENLEKDLYKWMSALQKTLEPTKKLSESEKELLVDFLEGKVQEVPEKIKKVAEPIRKYLDAVYSHAKENGVGISYRENYFPHVFEGHIRVQVGDDFVSVKTWDEAIEVAKKGIDEGKRVNIKAMLRPDIYELRITNPRFWALVKKLENGVELTEDEVKELLKSAGIGRRPAYRFVGNLLERKYDISGYIKDPETALKLYTNNIIRKIHQDKFLNKFERAYESVKDPKLRSLLDEYKAQVLGYPTKAEELTADVVNTLLHTKIGRWFLSKIGVLPSKRISPYDVRKVVSQSAFWTNYVPDLAYSMSSAVVNLTQFVTNAFPLLGAQGLKGALKYTKSLANPKIRQELFDAGILTESNFEGFKALTSIKEWKNPISALAKAGMSPFAFADLHARIMAYGGAKEYALKNGVEGMKKVLRILGVPEHDPLYQKIIDPKISLEEKARDFAREVVDHTQFRYEKFASPKLLAGSWGKLLLPYKTFLTNQLMLTAKVLTNGNIKHPKETLLFFAVPIALAGPYGNPVLLGAWKILKGLYELWTGEDLEEKLNKMGLSVVTKGIPATLGFDIRSTVKLDFPNLFKLEEWLGRPYRVGRYFMEGDSAKLERELKPRILRNIEEAKDMLQTGYIRDSKGRFIAPADMQEVIKAVLGFKPTEYYDFVEKKGEIYELDKEFKNKIEPWVNEYLDAIITGDADKGEKAYRKLMEIEADLMKKITESSGEVQKRYLYLYMKLLSSLKGEGLQRRAREKLVPFSSDKKKFILTQ